MREICKSGSEGGAGQYNAPFLPLSFEHLPSLIAVGDFVEKIPRQYLSHGLSRVRRLALKCAWQAILLPDRHCGYKCAKSGESIPHSGLLTS